MDWLRENWFWLAVVVLFLWMHGKMHGAHGGHGGHGGGGGCGGHAHDSGEQPEREGSDMDIRKEHDHAQH